jgi:hypothetical protein
MATTFVRLHVIARHIQDHLDRATVISVASEVRGRRLRDFRIRGDGASITDYMAETAIRQLVRLLGDLELIAIDDSGNIGAPRDHFEYLSSESAFALKVDAAVKTLLFNSGTPLGEVDARIKAVRPPDAPDAKTIYAALGEAVADMSEDRFTRLLFLLSCAGGLDRTVHVHYNVPSS